MKLEKVILSVIAIIVGLIAAAIAFYLYQMTKALPETDNKPISVNNTINTPTPTPNDDNFLTVDNPKDESVFDTKTIKVSGKTMPNSTVIVSTEGNSQVVTPAQNGDFSLNETIGEGTSVLTITAIFPNGDEKQIMRTVTYTTSNF